MALLRYKKMKPPVKVVAPATLKVPEAPTLPEPSTLKRPARLAEEVAMFKPLAYRLEVTVPFVTNNGEVRYPLKAEAALHPVQVPLTVRF